MHTLRGQPALGPYGSGRRPGHQGDSKEVHVAGVLFSHQVVSNSFVTLWTVAHQAPLSMRFHRQEHWSGLPFPSPGDLPNPGIEPMSPARQVDSLSLSHLGRPSVFLLYCKFIKHRNTFFLIYLQSMVHSKCAINVYCII